MLLSKIIDVILGTVIVVVLLRFLVDVVLDLFF